MMSHVSIRTTGPIIPLDWVLGCLVGQTNNFQTQSSVSELNICSSQIEF